jgi:hypothetical protein
MEVKEISSVKYKKATDEEKCKAKERMVKMRKDGEKLVKGMFEFIDAQGGWLDFTYRFFPGEPCRTVRINHGEICDLPMVLVKHLNNVYKKVRTMAPQLDESGRPTKVGMVTKISRTRFTPMDVLGDNLIGVGA